MNPYQNHYYKIYQKDIILSNNITTVSKLPKLEKISFCLGGNKSDDNYIISCLSVLNIITGQKPSIIQKNIRHQYIQGKADKDVIGAKVTLRGSRLYIFIYKLLFDIFPYIRQFDGLKLPAHKNIYCFIIKDIFSFRELIPLFLYFGGLKCLQCQFYFNTDNKSDILSLGRSLQLCFIS